MRGCDQYMSKSKRPGAVKEDVLVAEARVLLSNAIGILTAELDTFNSRQNGKSNEAREAGKTLGSALQVFFNARDKFERHITRNGTGDCTSGLDLEAARRDLNSRLDSMRPDEGPARFLKEP